MRSETRTTNEVPMSARELVANYAEKYFSTLAQKPEISTQHGIYRSARPDDDDDDDDRGRNESEWAEPRENCNFPFLHFSRKVTKCEKKTRRPTFVSELKIKFSADSSHCASRR